MAVVVVVVVGRAVTSIQTDEPLGILLPGAGLWFATIPGWAPAVVSVTLSVSRPARLTREAAVDESTPERSGTVTCSTGSTGSPKSVLGAGIVVVGAGIVSGSINGVGSTPSRADRMNLDQICAGYVPPYTTMRVFGGLMETS